MVFGRLGARMPGVVAVAASAAAPTLRVGMMAARPAVPMASASSVSSALPPFRFGASIQVRNSTKHASSQSRNGRSSGGKRLGPKKLGGSKVNASNVLFKQHGTKWHAGENVNRGRDFTLNADTPGFVQYYLGADEKKTASEWEVEKRARRSLKRFKSQPGSDVVSPLPMKTIYHVLPRKRSHPVSKHTYRRYIGVSLTRDQKLPILKGQVSPRLLQYARSGTRKTEDQHQLP